MKFSQWIGVIACLALIVSGFTNWTWYPDLHKYFTGFVSENNNYGKPGKLFTGLALIAITLFLIPKIWAKRWNVLVCVIIVAYAVKTFILFTSCYQGVCPEKQPGIWVMLVSTGVIFLCSLLPDMKVKDTARSNK